jgi:TorA maturation chaperone TorD
MDSEVQRKPQVASTRVRMRAPRNMSTDSQPDFALSRAKAYSFLASVYLRPPTKEVIAGFMRRPPFPMESQGLKMLKEFLSRNRLTPPELLHERLAREHLRLFGGLAYGRTPPPPYESVWRGEGRLMGKVTESVLKTYGEVGVDLTAETTEPADHIGIELSYLSHLCSREAVVRGNCDTNAAASYSRLQYSFLRHHIERWVPDFCEHIAKVDGTGFYQGIATLTKEFVLADSVTILEELRKNSSEQFSEEASTESLKSRDSDEKVNG